MLFDYSSKRPSDRLNLLKREFKRFSATTLLFGKIETGSFHSIFTMYLPSFKLVVSSILFIILLSFMDIGKEGLGRVPNVSFFQKDSTKLSKDCLSPILIWLLEMLGFIAETLPSVTPNKAQPSGVNIAIG